MDKRDNWHINKVRAFVLALSLGTVTTTLGVTIHVPTDYPSITEAVFGSSNYDTILVASGLYVEPNLMIDKVVTVISGTGEADCATIYGAGGEGLKILVWSTLQGFTITGYSEANIIINTGAVLKNLVVTGVNEPTSGMGIYCYGGWSFGEWENITVVGNRPTMGNNVGGIYLYVDDHIPEWPFISRCIVAFNEGYGVDVSTDNWFSGGYFFSWGPPLSASNVFGNQQGDYPPDSEVLTKHFGILSSDPRFVDWESGNFELMPNSPCLPEGNYCRTLMGALGMTDPTAVDDELALASNLRLLQNFPNPFNPCTRIDFYLGVGQIVTVSIYDASGRRVSELLCNHPLEAGHHSIAWHGDSDSGESVASGVYFIQIKTPLDSQRRKMLLLK